MVLVFRDNTQRREAERVKKKAAEDLARHSELLERTNAELQHFAYAASHDLREPLRTITAYTQLVQLRSAAQLDKKQRGVFAIHRGGRRTDGAPDRRATGLLQSWGDHQSAAPSPFHGRGPGQRIGESEWVYRRKAMR